MSETLALFSGGIGWQEIVLLGLVALLIFGRKLPEVGKSLGKGIVEFKKGLAGIEEDIDGTAATPQPKQRIDADNSQQASATQRPAEAEPSRTDQT